MMHIGLRCNTEKWHPWSAGPPGLFNPYGSVTGYDIPREAAVATNISRDSYGQGWQVLVTGLSRCGHHTLLWF